MHIYHFGNAWIPLLFQWKEKKQNIKLKVIKNVKPEKTERIYKTEVNADAKFGMNDILVFFYEKYDGDWDSIYNAICEKEPVDKNKCKGCSICSRVCPTKAIMMKYDKNGELFAQAKSFEEDFLIVNPLENYGKIC